MQNPNGSSIAADVTCPLSAAVNDAKAAMRSRLVPRCWRRRTFATLEADRSTPRFLRCRSSDRGPNVGRATASDKMTATSSLLHRVGLVRLADTTVETRSSWATGWPLVR